MKHCYMNVLIVGDFNLPELHWIEGLLLQKGLNTQIAHFWTAFMNISYTKQLIFRPGIEVGRTQPNRPFVY